MALRLGQGAQAWPCHDVPGDAAADEDHEDDERDDESTPAASGRWRCCHRRQVERSGHERPPQSVVNGLPSLYGELGSSGKRVPSLGHLVGAVSPEQARHPRKQAPGRSSSRPARPGSAARRVQP